MNMYLHKRSRNIIYRIVSVLVMVAFIFTGVLGPTSGYAQVVAGLPVPGTMIAPTPGFAPALMKGIRVYPDNPLQFDFIVDSGHSKLTGPALDSEAMKMIKYFLATLTVPDADLWVNLSPYEQGRVVPEKLGETDMGRDLLAQDYILKQLTASLIYPENELGKKFWDRVYKRAQELYGKTDIPVNTFNKVWVVPQKAVVYEEGDAAYVAHSHLKVMLEQDYVAQQHNRSLQNNLGRKEFGTDKMNAGDVASLSEVSAKVIREVIIPEIEKEVNEGQNFASLRQIYNSMILATWFKQALKSSLLGQVYVNQNKTKGIDLEDKQIKDKIYNQYLEAFKKGVYSYIKEEQDPVSMQIVPRKYFSGGFDGPKLSQTIERRRDRAMLAPMELRGLRPAGNTGSYTVALVENAGKEMAAQITPKRPAAAADPAMLAQQRHTWEDVKQFSGASPVDLSGYAINVIREDASAQLLQVEFYHPDSESPYTTKDMTPPAAAKLLQILGAEAVLFPERFIKRFADAESATAEALVDQKLLDKYLLILAAQKMRTTIKVGQGNAQDIKLLVVLAEEKSGKHISPMVNALIQEILKAFPNLSYAQAYRRNPAGAKQRGFYVKGVRYKLLSTGSNKVPGLEKLKGEISGWLDGYATQQMSDAAMLVKSGQRSDPAMLGVSVSKIGELQKRGPIVKAAVMKYLPAAVAQKLLDENEVIMIDKKYYLKADMAVVIAMMLTAIQDVDLQRQSRGEKSNRVVIFDETLPNAKAYADLANIFLNDELGYEFVVKNGVWTASKTLPQVARKLEAAYSQLELEALPQTRPAKAYEAYSFMTLPVQVAMKPLNGASGVSEIALKRFTGRNKSGEDIQGVTLIAQPPKVMKERADFLNISSSDTVVVGDFYLLIFNNGVGKFKVFVSPEGKGLVLVRPEEIAAAIETKKAGKNIVDGMIDIKADLDLDDLGDIQSRLDYNSLIVFSPKGTVLALNLLALENELLNYATGNRVFKKVVTRNEYQGQRELQEYRETREERGPTDLLEYNPAGWYGTGHYESVYADVKRLRNLERKDKIIAQYPASQIDNLEMDKNPEEPVEDADRAMLAEGDAQFVKSQIAKLTANYEGDQIVWEDVEANDANKKKVFESIEATRPVLTELMEKVANEPALQAQAQKIQEAITVLFDKQGRSLRKNLQFYPIHPLQVTLNFIKRFGITDPEFILSALLHDAMEEISEFGATPGLIGEQFGRQVQSDVQSLTNKELSAAQREWLTGYIKAAMPSIDDAALEAVRTILEYQVGVAGEIAGYSRTLLLKSADFSDNALRQRGLASKPQLQSRLSSKYRDLIAIFAEEFLNLAQQEEAKGALANVALVAGLKAAAGEYTAAFAEVSGYAQGWQYASQLTAVVEKIKADYGGLRGFKDELSANADPAMLAESFPMSDPVKNFPEFIAAVEKQRSAIAAAYSPGVASVQIGQGSYGLSIRESSNSGYSNGAESIALKGSEIHTRKTHSWGSYDGGGGGGASHQGVFSLQGIIHNEKVLVPEGRLTKFPIAAVKLQRGQITLVLTKEAYDALPSVSSGVAGFSVESADRAMLATATGTFDDDDIRGRIIQRLVQQGLAEPQAMAMVTAAHIATAADLLTQHNDFDVAYDAKKGTLDIVPLEGQGKWASPATQKPVALTRLLDPAFREEFLVGTKTGINTFMMIQPDGMDFREDILRELRRAGFEVLEGQKMVLTEAQARLFYKEQEAHPAYQSAVKDLIAGKVMPLFLTRRDGDAIERATAVQAKIRSQHVRPSGADDLYTDAKEGRIAVLSTPDSPMMARIRTRRVFQFIDQAGDTLAKKPDPAMLSGTLELWENVQLGPEDEVTFEIGSFGEAVTVHSLEGHNGGRFARVWSGGGNFGRLLGEAYGDHEIKTDDLRIWVEDDAVFVESISRAAVSYESVDRAMLTAKEDLRLTYQDKAGATHRYEFLPLHDIRRNERVVTVYKPGTYQQVESFQVADLEEPKGTGATKLQVRNANGELIREELHVGNIIPKVREEVLAAGLAVEPQTADPAMLALPKIVQAKKSKLRRLIRESAGLTREAAYQEELAEWAGDPQDMTQREIDNINALLNSPGSLEEKELEQLRSARGEWVDALREIRLRKRYRIDRAMLSGADQIARESQGATVRINRREPVVYLGDSWQITSTYNPNRDVTFQAAVQTVPDKSTVAAVSGKEELWYSWQLSETGDHLKDSVADIVARLQANAQREGAKHTGPRTIVTLQTPEYKEKERAARETARSSGDHAMLAMGAEVQQAFADALREHLKKQDAEFRQEKKGQPSIYTTISVAAEADKPSTIRFAVGVRTKALLTPQREVLIKEALLEVVHKAVQKQFPQYISDGKLVKVPEANGFMLTVEPMANRVSPTKLIKAWKAKSPKVGGKIEKVKVGDNSLEFSWYSSYYQQEMEYDEGQNGESVQVLAKKGNVLVVRYKKINVYNEEVKSYYYDVVIAPAYVSVKYGPIWKDGTRGKGSPEKTGVEGGFMGYDISDNGRITIYLSRAGMKALSSSGTDKQFLNVKFQQSPADSAMLALSDETMEGVLGFIQLEAGIDGNTLDITDVQEEVRESTTVPELIGRLARRIGKPAGEVKAMLKSLQFQTPDGEVIYHGEADLAMLGKSETFLRQVQSKLKSQLEEALAVLDPRKIKTQPLFTIAIRPDGKSGNHDRPEELVVEVKLTTPLSELLPARKKAAEPRSLRAAFRREKSTRRPRSTAPDLDTKIRRALSKVTGDFILQTAPAYVLPRYGSVTKSENGSYLVKVVHHQKRWSGFVADVKSKLKTENTSRYTSVAVLNAGVRYQGWANADSGDLPGLVNYSTEITVKDQKVDIKYKYESSLQTSHKDVEEARILYDLATGMLRASSYGYHDPERGKKEWADPVEITKKMPLALRDYVIGKDGGFSLVVSPQLAKVIEQIGLGVGFIVEQGSSKEASVSEDPAMLGAPLSPEARKVLARRVNDFAGEWRKANVRLEGPAMITKSGFHPIVEERSVRLGLDDRDEGWENLSRYEFKSLDKGGLSVEFWQENTTFGGEGFAGDQLRQAVEMTLRPRSVEVLFKNTRDGRVVYEKKESLDIPDGLQDFRISQDGEVSLVLRPEVMAKFFDDYTRQEVMPPEFGQMLKLESATPAPDAAMLGKQTPVVNKREPVGGINLDPALLDLQIKRDGKGIPLPLPLQPIQNMRIDGFLPIIINVVPVNLPLMLGLGDEPADPLKIGGEPSPSKADNRRSKQTAVEARVEQLSKLE